MRLKSVKAIAKPVMDTASVVAMEAVSVEEVAVAMVGAVE